jgi:soluble lytic murein transglycosylase-like protein
LLLLLVVAFPVAYANDLQSYIKSNCKYNCVSATKLSDTVKAVSALLDLGKEGPAILTAIIHTESNFNVRAKSKTSTNTGLMQVSTYWHKDKFPRTGINRYNDIYNNIYAGALVYRDCLTKHRGNYKTALRCYNGYNQGDPRYVNKVMTRYNVIAKLDPGINIYIDVPVYAKNDYYNYLIASLR